MKTAEEWSQAWEALSDEGLRAVALLRMIECANGTVQYAFRDNDPRALSVEQTREAMALSMGTIKNKVVPIGDGVPLPEEIHEVMNEMRHLYVSGFKNQNPKDLEEFMVASVANVRAVGKSRLDDAEAFVREHFTEVFTSDFITYGRMYLDGLLDS